jgi:site-specific DNA recombinase
MYVPSNTPKYVCFKCRNKIPVVDLEGVFQEQLKNFFLSSSDILKCLNEVDVDIKKKEELLTSLMKAQQKVRREMDVVFRLHVNGKISMDGFAERNTPLEERLRQIEEQIPQLQGELDYLKIQYVSRDQILTEARDIYTRWPELQNEEKRTIVEHTLGRVCVGKDDISFELSYVPPSASHKIMVDGQQKLRDSWPQPA